MAGKPAITDAQTIQAGRGFLANGRMRLGMGLTGILLLAGLVAVWVARPATQPPAEQVAQSLKLLDAGKFGPAREIAQRLEEQGYKHPGFAGVLNFVQGMATFGIIEASGEAGERAQHAYVIKQLRDAERLALAKDRRPEWCYALGKSLYLVQDGAEARPLLEESLKTHPACRIDASEMLVDLYLDPGVRTPELLRQALELNDDVIASDTPDPRKFDIACLQRAEIFLATKREADAAGALKKLSKATAKSHLAQLLQARILLAHGTRDSYRQAMERLKPIATNDRIAPTHAAEACYLTGLAALQLSEMELDPAADDDTKGKGYRSEAVRFFERTADRYDQTPEAVAANLRLGRLMRLANSHERSLEAYGSALKSLDRPESFRNRWLSLEQFRESILEAWNNWVENRRFDKAISLSEMMTPLFPREEACEYAARVHQRWAEGIAADLADRKYSERRARNDELLHRWRESAKAYVKLAEVRVSSPKYPEALWNAADLFRRGHDFERALELINQFLATEPDRLMAAALVQRSRIELDLDRISEALADLQQVVRNYPTDPATFSAQYLIGVCYFELNRLDEAKAAWQGILTSDQLSPSAVEWRDAQLALGRLQFEQGELKRRETGPRSTPASPSVELSAYREALKHWQEAARLLGRYLDRNQTGSGVNEARYYLGKSLQREAEWHSRQLKVAETDNARQQLESQRDAALYKSLRQFEELRDELLAGQTNDQIDDLQQRLLTSCVFEIPHTWFELREYDKAITAYNAAINKYPQDVRTMVAYIQMGQCHRERGRKIDARNMIQQAKLLLSHKQIPAENFLVPSTNFSPAEWEAWLERARQVD